MGKVIFYSEAEEFLHGIETGIEFTNDGGLVPGLTQESGNIKYPYMLVVEDGDQSGTTEKYYDGTSFSHQEVID